jgi:transposase
MASQQITQRLGVHTAVGEGGVGAAPPTLMDRLQAQVRQRRDRLGAKQRVAQLEQRIGAAREAGMQLSPEPAEPLKGESGLGHDRAACTTQQLQAT